jgi:hypothetical protein
MRITRTVLMSAVGTAPPARQRAPPLPIPDTAAAAAVADAETPTTPRREALRKPTGGFDDEDPPPPSRDPSQSLFMICLLTGARPDRIEF